MAIPAVLYETSAIDTPGDGAAGMDAGRRVLVHDLACDGFSLEAPALPPGAYVAIDLPGTGRRTARVTGAGAGAGLYRCRFSEPLPPALLPRILAAAPGRTGASPPEPHIRKWPPAIRVALLVGLALLLWATALRFLL